MNTVDYPCWVYKGGESKIICRNDNDEDNKAEKIAALDDGWADSPAKKAKPKKAKK